MALPDGRGAGAVLALSIAVASLGASCGPDPSDDVPFPTDYATRWREARTCAISHDHELRYIQTFVNDLADEPYATFASPYPPGSILLKPEFDDEFCTELLAYTVMVKLEPGDSPDTQDWRWLRYDAERRPIEEAGVIPEGCIACHRWHCGELPYGWDLTCAPDLEPPAM